MIPDERQKLFEETVRLFPDLRVISESMKEFNARLERQRRVIAVEEIDKVYDYDA
jgi:hypothetical protein